MSEWPSFSVAELQREGVLLVEDGNHGQYRPLRDEFVNGGVAYVRAADMVNGQVDFEHTGGINADALARIRKGVGRPGDILFSHKGTVGKLARVAFGSPPFVCSPQTTFWRVLDHDRLSRAYLYAYMRSRVFIQQWWACKGSTDMADYVSLTDQRRLRVSLPPLVEQKRIAATLVILDDLIENNRRRIEVLEQMAQAIYREWFVRFRYPGHEHATFVDSPLGPIPEGWTVDPFSSLATFVNGFAFKPAHLGTSGRPIIKIKELKQGVVDSTPRCDPTDIDRRYWIDPGDLLFSWSADLGVYLWSFEPGLLNQHLFVVGPLGGLSRTFLFHALDIAMPHFWDRAQGTTMRHIKRSALTEVQTVVPSPDLVLEFSDTVGPLDAEALTLRFQTAELFYSARSPSPQTGVGTD